MSKCANLDEARTLLRRLRGKKHDLISALVLVKAGSAIWRHVETATLWMRDFSDTFLDEYLIAEGRGASEGCGLLPA